MDALEDVTQAIVEFRDRRSWKQFHSITAGLSIEAGLGSVCGYQTFLDIAVAIGLQMERGCTFDFLLNRRPRFLELTQR
jgi:hypothetical protein